MISLRTRLLIIGVLGVAGLLNVVPAGAAVVTWVPDANGYWHVAANWSCNPLLPGPQDDALIDVGGAAVRTVTLSQGTHAIASIASEENVALTGGSLTVAGSVQVNAAFTLNGGTLIGATILPGSASQGLTVLNNTSNRLEGVTAEADMDMAGGFSRAQIRSGLTVNGTCTLDDSATLTFDVTPGGSQTFGGSGEVVFLHTAGYVPNLVIEGDQIVTLASGLTLRGFANLGRSSAVSGIDTLINQGRIRADTGNAMVIRSDVFSNAGTIEAVNGGTLTVQSVNWSSGGTIRAANGATTNLRGTSWSSTGTIEIDGATVNLEAPTTFAGLGTFSRTGGTVNLKAALDGTAATLDLDSTGIGDLVVDGGGQILGGTVTASGNAKLIFRNDTGNRMDGVTVDADVDMTGGWSRVKIRDGLTLNGIITLDNSALLSFDVTAGGSQTLDGAGEVVFQYTGGYTPSLTIEGNETLTVASGMTLRGRGSIGQSTYTSGTDTLINRGTIEADATPLTVKPDVFTHAGTLRATGGGTISVTSPAFTGSGVVAIDAGSRVNVSNAYAQTSAGMLQIEIDTLSRFGKLAVTGTLNLGGAGQGGTLKVDVIGAGLQAGDKVDILDFAVVVGTFGTLDLAAPGPGLTWDTGDLYVTGEIRAVQAPLRITAWESIRTHGSGVGELAIELDPARPVSEPRHDGIQQIAVQFSEAVQPADGTLDDNDVSITDSAANAYTATSLTLIQGGTKLLLEFNAGVLPDQMRYTFEILADKFESVATGLLLGGDTDCEVRGLVGDASNDGYTNLIDMAKVKSRNGSPATAADDVNVDGEVNLIDAALVKSLNGRAAP